MKTRVLLSALLLINCALLSQAQTGGAGQHIRYWSDGPLTENDFSKRDKPDRDGNTSDMLYGMNKKNETRKIGNLKVESICVYAYMDPVKSWIVQDSVSIWGMKSHQNIFDLTEAIAREYESALLNHEGKEGIDDYYDRLFHSLAAQYDSETEYGHDTTAIALAEQRLSEKLKAGRQELTEDFLEQQIKEINNREGFSFTFSMGLELGVPFGKASAYMGSYMPQAYAETELRFKHRWPLMLVLSSGNAGRMQQTGIKDWKQGEVIKTNLLSARPGYLLIDSPRWRLEPFIGIGYRSFSQEIKNGDGATKTSIISSLQMEIGTDIGYKLSRTLSLCEGTYYESCIGLKLFAWYSNIPMLGPMWSLNIGINVLGMEGRP